MEADFTHRHLDDVKKIQRVLLDNGRFLSLSASARLWENYSESMAVGWMYLPEDDDTLWLATKHLLINPLLYPNNGNAKISVDINQSNGKINLEFSSNNGKFGTDEMIAGFNLTPERLLEALQSFDFTDDEL